MIDARSEFHPAELLARGLSDDPNDWIATAREGVWLRPILFDTVSGGWVNITRIRCEGFISRHAHPCPVHAYVLAGEWRYAERDWIARAGDYLFEPAGDIHTLLGLPGGSDTLFNIAGALIELDEQGQTIGYADVFSRIEQAAAHFAAVGLGRDYVRKFIR